MVRTSPRHRRIVERTRARRSHCRRHVIGDFAWLRRLANVEYPDSRFEISAVLRKNSNPLDLSWWRDYWPAVASSQRDRSASYRPSVAGRPGRADRALGQTPASHRSREFGPASSAGALQGAGHEIPAHRCRDARKLGLAVAVLRLALLPGDRPSGNRAAVAPSRLATILALQVATGASADFSRPAATHMAHGQGESAMGRGKNCKRVAAEAWFAGLAAYRAQVHAEATARSRTR